MMIHAAQSLEKAGADLVLICTNTMHKMADNVQTSIGIPLLIEQEDCNVPLFDTTTIHAKYAVETALKG